jgi:uncharacterized protein (DUF1501 family)
LAYSTIGRRDLLKRGALFVSMSLTVPSFLAKTVEGTSDRSLSSAYGRRKTLVVVQLGGGNDGLNTLVPYADQEYYRLRPTVNIAPANVLGIADGLGMNPALAALKSRFDQRQVAMVQGVGYPNPNRSHFRAMEIWQTAEPAKPPTEGWLGRYLDASCCGEDRPVQSPTLGALNFGDRLPLTLWTEHVLVPSIGSIGAFRFQTDGGEAPDERMQHLDTFKKLYAQSTAPHVYDDFVRRVGRDAVETSETIQAIAKTYTPAVTYPTSGFANQLKQVAQIMTGDLGTRIFYVQMGGFDTHANQLADHARLLQMFSEGLDAFFKDLEAHGWGDDVMVMAFSEFGRRVAENGSAGTDHGAAAPMFLVGPRVKGGIYGKHPSLTDLTSGDLRHGTDFREVYASVIKDWMEGDSKAVIGDFEPLPLLQSSPAPVYPPLGPVEAGKTRILVPMGAR